MATASDDSLNDRGASGTAVAQGLPPRGEFSTGQLVDHLEWSYNEGLPFDADVVWELARRALAAESGRDLPSSDR